MARGKNQGHSWKDQRVRHEFSTTYNCKRTNSLFLTWLFHEIIFARRSISSSSLQFQLSQNNLYVIVIWRIAGPHHKSEKKNPQRISRLGSFSIFRLCFFPPPRWLYSSIHQLVPRQVTRKCHSGTERSIVPRMFHAVTVPQRCGELAGCKFESKTIDVSLFRSIVLISLVLQFIENYRLDLENFCFELDFIEGKKLEFVSKVVDCKIDRGWNGSIENFF